MDDEKGLTMAERGQEMAAAAGVALSQPQLADLVEKVDNLVENDPLFQDFSRQLGNGANLFGGLRLGGGATWGPVRDQAADWSGWGDWEAWEECQIGVLNGGAAIGPVPTGQWLAVNMANPAQVIGIPAGPTSRKQAEMWAHIRNGGLKTRVVPHQGEPVASELEYVKLVMQMGAEMARLRAQLPGG